MPSPSPVPRESWLRCRHSFERGLAHDTLFTTPLQVIDWAVAHGVADRLHASMSIGLLVISDRPRPWQAVRGCKLVVIPKPDSVELRLYRDAALAEMIEIDRSRLHEELDRLVSQFR